MNLLLKLPIYVYLYFFCQSIHLITAVISVAIVAAVGNHISSNSLYATVPYGMQFLFQLLGTYPTALLMRKYGRKPGFIIGAIFLFFAGIIGYFSVVEESFALLMVSHSFIGLFTACANFYRYAATDGLIASLQSSSLSLVVAGGIIAALLGPAISSELKNIAGFPQFSLCYASLIILALINLFIIFFLPDLGTVFSKSIKTHEVIKVKDLRIIFTAICAAAFGYGLMNLLMIQSSLKMNYMCIAFEDTAFAIQWHVVAMFFPSFFTGALVVRLGPVSVIVSGFILFIASFLINIQDVSYFNIIAALILLGLGWNFTYIGGSIMLTTCLTNNSEKQKWQGIGDTIIVIFATIGAMSPSFLLNGLGWEKSNIISIVLCLIPLSALILLKLKN